MNRLRAVLFDLDGTLLDTAPDLAGALAQVLLEQGRAPLPYAQVRAHVSLGSEALIQLAFPQAFAQEQVRLRARFLECYAARLHAETRLFPGMQATLDRLQTIGFALAVVTNKPGWLTEPLLRGLDLHRRFGCVVSGDTLPYSKPDPRPLWHAAAQLGHPAADSVYWGDAERDIQAGRAAGMHTLLAAWGYLHDQDDPAQWQPDACLESPDAFWSWLEAVTGQTGP